MTFTNRLVPGTAQLTFSNGTVKLLSIITMPILTVLTKSVGLWWCDSGGSVISLAPIFALMWHEWKGIKALIQAGNL